MSKMLISSSLIASFLTLAVFSLTAEESAGIIEKMEQTMIGESQYAEMTMKIVRPRYEREISMKTWLMGRDYSMILITAPARDQGTSFLMRENDIWTYDPRIDRTTRMPSSMMAQSWMGSDFTNDDLVRDSDLLDDYEHRLVRTEEYEGRECYVIELIPKPESPIVWGKVKMWISTGEYIQMRIEQYDQQDELVNTMRMEEIKPFGDRNLPSRITVQPADDDKKRTVMTYQKIQFDIDIDKGFFTQRNMQRLD